MVNVKKLLRRAKNREREMAIVAAKTVEVQQKLAVGEEITRSPKVTHEPTDSAFRDLAMTQAGLVSQDVTQANVAQACKAMVTQVRMNGHAGCRTQVLHHLPAEIRKVLQGRTAQEAFDFYWSLDDFRRVWPMLHFTELDLRSFVNTGVRQLGRDDLLEVRS